MTKTKSTLQHYRPFSQGQKVWLKGKNLFMTHPTTKLAPKQFSPFKILRVLSPVVYQLILLAQWKQKRIHNVFHTSLLTPYHKTEAHRANYLEPPPNVIDREEEYEVEKILDSKRIGWGQKLHYLILLCPSSRHSRSRILVSKDIRIRVSHISVNPSCHVSKWTKSWSLVWLSGIWQSQAIGLRIGGLQGRIGCEGLHVMICFLSYWFIFCFVLVFVPHLVLHSLPFFAPVSLLTYVWF